MSARDLIVGDGRILVGSALERLAELYADVAHAAVERIERDCEASQVKFSWEVA